MHEKETTSPVNLPPSFSAWFFKEIPAIPWQRFAVKVLLTLWLGLKWRKKRSSWTVSGNSGCSPQIIHFYRVFHFKPSILGYPCFWKDPYGEFSGVCEKMVAEGWACRRPWSFHAALLAKYFSHVFSWVWQGIAEHLKAVGRLYQKSSIFQVTNAVSCTLLTPIQPQWFHQNPFLRTGFLILTIILEVYAKVVGVFFWGSPLACAKSQKQQRT